MKVVHSWFALFMLISFLSLGCGASDEPTIIQPAEDFQPTAQDVENQKRFDSMRDQQGEE